MSKGWQEAYSGLTNFIAEHSEVEIGATRFRLPDNVRPEFYRLFNAVRTALIEEKFTGLLSEARLLSENYLKAEQEVTELLGLDDVSMMPSLGRFLHDPTDGLRRGLFAPLFDLLKAKVGIETFEEAASQNIKASFGPLYQLGYEKWVALYLVKLLKADKSFQVILPVLSPQEVYKGPSEEPVPPPKESKHLSFQYEPSSTLTLPDFIVHSARLNRYVAIRLEFRAAMWTASNASEKREWYTPDSIVVLEPGLTLVYVDDNPEEISLVADTKRICRPDLIIECRELKDWYEKEGIGKVKLHHDSLKPILGTYIVSRETVPEQALAQLEDDVHILEVGFDTNKLAPIVDALIKTVKGKDQ